MNRCALIHAMLTCTAVLGGCGSSSSASTPTLPANPDVTVTGVDGIKWDATSYSATSHGGNVVLVAENTSSLGHNLFVIAADGTEEPQSINLATHNSSGSATFKLAPGNYTIICKVPGHSNMKARLVVT